MSIIEQLEEKITLAIQALENLQLENLQLQEDLARVQEELNTVQMENARLSDEKTDHDSRLSQLVSSLEAAVSEFQGNEQEEEYEQSDNDSYQQPTYQQNDDFNNDNQPQEPALQPVWNI